MLTSETMLECPLNKIEEEYYLKENWEVLVENIRKLFNNL